MNQRLLFSLSSAVEDRSMNIASEKSSKSGLGKVIDVGGVVFFGDCMKSSIDLPSNGNILR